MQAIDRLGREAHRRVEPERVRRLDDVVVDGLGYADDRDPHLEELVGNPQGAIAADDHKAVELHLVVHLDHPRRVIALAATGVDWIGEGIPAVGGAEDGAPDAKDTDAVPGGEQPRSIGLDQSVEAVLEAQHLAVAVCGRLDYRPDDGVEPGGISSASQDAEPLHTGLLLGNRHPKSIRGALHRSRESRVTGHRMEPNSGRKRPFARCTCANVHAKLLFEFSAASRGIQISTTTSGRLAQLGERRVRNAEVGSSILPPSTKIPHQHSNSSAVSG